MTTQRKLSIYEQNQLRRFGFSNHDLLSQGELPVEYLTGSLTFKNLDLKVNQAVLIPRVETEDLVDLICEFSHDLINRGEAINYLEVGTGSGAISLAFFDDLIKHKSVICEQFVMTDISKEALSLAQENFQRLFAHPLLNKLKFLESDLLQQIFVKPKPQATKFNLIVANLPYIPSSAWHNLDSSVKDFEPKLALDGGVNGFVLINRLLEQILEKNLLTDHGKIFLEVYETHQKAYIEANFPKLTQHFVIKEQRDQFARHRFLILQKP